MESGYLTIENEDLDPDTYYTFELKVTNYLGATDSMQHVAFVLNEDKSLIEIQGGNYFVHVLSSTAKY